MRVTICTGLSPAGYTAYGQNALATFDRYWPSPVRLLAYTEEPIAMPRGECRSLWDVTGALEFFERHKGNRVSCGLEPNEHWNARAHAKHAAGGAAWRWDALKWFRQCLIPHDASRDCEDGELLAWLDGDVVSFSPVSGGLVEGLIGNFDLAYLGRHRGSEIGFWVVRLSYGTRAFLKAFADAYRTDDVFTMKEWHSAFVFDEIRGRFQSRGMTAVNLTPPGKRGVDHVFGYTPLGASLDHLKGKRKALGYSPEFRSAA